jgi:hypothetical protein
MNVTTIITELLRKVPRLVRLTLLALFALTVVTEAILRILEVDLDYGKIDQILVYIGGYLGVQSAANVTTIPEQVVLDEGA